MMVDLQDAHDTGGGRAETTSAVRGGAYMGLASALGIGLNYAFLVLSGRLLGADDYGELAAVLGLSAIVLLPTAGIQMAVSREVSRDIAGGAASDAAAFSHAALRVAFLATVPLVVVAALVSVPLSGVVDVPTSALVVGSLTLVAAFLAPVGMGAIQGEQRFSVLAVVTAGPFVVRIVVLAVVAAAGATLVGAVAAVAVAAVAAVALSLVPVRHVLRRPPVPPSALVPFTRYLVPVVVGLLAMSLLVNVDVIVVNARFPDEESGSYAAAAAFGRVAYFFPATILAVLFPRTAARQARGEETDDILGRSLIVTAAFCIVLAVFYALVGEPLVTYSFGSDFDDAARLLPLFALEMMLISAANVLVGFHLSRGETRFAWIAVAAVPVQVLALVTIPDSVLQIILVNIVVAAGLLVVHEIAMGSSLPAIRVGARRLRPRRR